MKVQSVCIIGGSGFLGSHIIQRLAAQGIQVRVPTRRRERAKHLIVLPTVDVVNADVHDPRALARLVSGTDAVISLAGILHERRAGDFARVHAELPRKIVDACRDKGVPRLLHVSALKAAHDAPSAYLRSKAGGEQQVRVAQASGIRTTVFRPSVIFGRGDSFLTLFARMAQWLPVIALASPRARFQPVFVEDVTQALVTSLEDAQTHDRSFDLCGPQVYTLLQLVQYVCSVVDLERPVIPLNDRFSYLQAWVMEKLPVKLMTRDNLLSMQADNVCDCPFPAVFGIKPTPLEAIAPLYLRDAAPRSRYRWMRLRAGR